MVGNNTVQKQLLMSVEVASISTMQSAKTSYNLMGFLMPHMYMYIGTEPVWWKVRTCMYMHVHVYHIFPCEKHAICLWHACDSHAKHTLLSWKHTFKTAFKVNVERNSESDRLCSGTRSRHDCRPVWTKQFSWRLNTLVWKLLLTHTVHIDCTNKWACKHIPQGELSALRQSFAVRRIIDLSHVSIHTCIHPNKLIPKADMCIVRYMYMKCNRATQQVGLRKVHKQWTDHTECCNFLCAYESGITSRTRQTTS